MKYQIAPEISKKLKAGLPWGTGKKIAKRLGYTESYVSKVLNGTEFNEKVYNAFLKAYKDHQEFCMMQNQRGQLTVS
jgi:hypothetical protein